MVVVAGVAVGAGDWPVATELVAAVIFTGWVTRAVGEPLQLAVWPVNTTAVEQPVSSVTVNVTV